MSAVGSLLLARGPRLGPAVTVIVVLHMLAALAFGLMALVAPENQFPELVRNADGEFAVALYANRNVGVGVALAVALGLRQAWMLTALFVVRLVTDLGDFVEALVAGGGAGAAAGSSIFFALLFASELFVIRRLVLGEIEQVGGTTGREAGTGVTQ